MSLESILLFSGNSNSIHLIRYTRLIKSRPLRVFKSKSGLVRHHIHPKSFGAAPDFKSEPDNIIVLTNREHFIAHLILWKAFGGKMATAFYAVCQIGTGSEIYRSHSFLSSRSFQKLQTKVAENQSIRMSGENHPNYGKPSYMKGRKASEETRNRQSLALSGRKMSDENKDKVRESALKREAKFKLLGENNPKLGRKLSEDAKQRIRISKLGGKASEETKLKMSQLRKGKPNLKMSPNFSRKGKKASEETRLKMKILCQNRPIFICFACGHSSKGHHAIIRHFQKHKELGLDKDSIYRQCSNQLEGDSHDE